MKLNELVYTGPSMVSLKDEYARRGHVDERAPIQATYAVDIDAPVGDVWRILTDPTSWHSWYSEIQDVHLDASVEVDGTFTWKNGSSKLRSTFVVVEPEREIAWTGTSMGSKAVHRHVLEATAEGRTRVVTEESMAGPLLVLFYSSAKLQAGLVAWLDALKAAAEQK